ncbi:MAG TPA: efflux RND transporter periplasmic adaptor subunit [Polyangiaceae bacterium]|jgi:RND family efflux transporter MFP subunit|nr:efflux RND transporter periplasmic adaptor subunit [Polyangiaceae bacterium]
MKHVSSPSTGSNTPERVKAPLAGVLVGLALVGALGAWTARRISAAEVKQQQVADKRTQDAERVASLVNAPPSVHVIALQPARWQPHVEFDGTLAAQQAASLSFKLPGKLSRVAVRVGDEVKTGALLASLDTREASAQVAASTAQVRAAEAQLALADDNQKRTTSLVQSGSFAAAGAVQTEQQRALAQAQLDAARAQVSLAQVSLGQHTLVAPFAGTVTEAPDGVGAVVNPGQALFRVVNVKELKLSATVSESDANLLSVGTPVTLQTEKGKVEGKISALLSALDERTRRVPVVADFDNPGSLRAGSFVRARVDAGKPIDVLKLSRDALRPGSDDEVAVVHRGSPTTLELRKIVYALDTDGNLLVRMGLQANDVIVQRPKPEVKTGDVVSVEASEGSK